MCVARENLFCFEHEHDINMPQNHEIYLPRYFWLFIVNENGKTIFFLVLVAKGKQMKK